MDGPTSRKRSLFQKRVEPTIQDVAPSEINEDDADMNTNTKEDRNQDRNRDVNRLSTFSIQRESCRRISSLSSEGDHYTRRRGRSFLLPPTAASQRFRTSMYEDSSSLEEDGSKLSCGSYENEFDESIQSYADRAWFIILPK